MSTPESPETTGNDNTAAQSLQRVRSETKSATLSARTSGWSTRIMADDNGNNRDGVELAYASLAVFADDGKLDMGEFNFLLGLAMRDGELSESEIAVLRNVFNRVLEHDVSADVWKRIQAVREQHSI